jgi:hypothetical protein
MARKLVKQLASVLKGLEADVESLTLNSSGQTHHFPQDSMAIGA